jgi:hypothetical protein
MHSRGRLLSSPNDHWPLRVDRGSDRLKLVGERTKSIWVQEDRARLAAKRGDENTRNIGGAGDRRIDAQLDAGSFKSGSEG